MLLDIDKKEINVGDTCICTLSSRQCYKITIVKITAVSIHYTALSEYGSLHQWKSYMRKSSDAALNMYKV